MTFNHGNVGSNPIGRTSLDHSYNGYYSGLLIRQIRVRIPGGLLMQDICDVIPVGFLSSSTPKNNAQYASVAQLVERSPCKRLVAGSSPVVGSHLSKSDDKKMCG